MFDISSLTMTEIIRLQNQLQQELTRRFERPLALAFSDIVGSTAYFARFGDAAGRQLQQLHFDLLAECIGSAGGRVVDTAGDGAFLVFAQAGAAVDGARALQNATARANEGRGRQQQLVLRIGLHWGRVLSDGSAVSGDAVNLCARVAASAQPGELRLTRPLFQELQREHRLNCRSLGDAALPGFAAPIELLTLDWRDPALFPRSLVIEETQERVNLPRQDIVAFGRLQEHNGVHANDIVLTHPDPALQRQISRWHFELRRTEHGMHLVALSDSGTTVDGRSVERGGTAPVRAASRIGVAGVLTLRLQGPEGPASQADDNSTMMLAGPARGLPTGYDG